MMELAAPVLKEMIGTIASGPVGHEVFHEVVGGTTIDPNAQAVPVQLNTQSVQQAQARVEDKFAQKYGKEALQQASPAAATRQSQGEKKLDDMLAKRGLSGALRRSGAYYGALRREANYEKAPPAPAPAAKPQNVLQRMQEERRQLHATRARFSQIQRTMLAPLPQAVKENQLRRSAMLKAKPSVAGVMPQKKKQRDWALFFNPHLIPTGWATHS